MKMTIPKMLILDDNALVRQTIATLATELGFAVVEAASIEAARVLLAGGEIDVLLCDDDLGTSVSGLDFIANDLPLMPATVVLMSGNPKPCTLPVSTRYLAKPFTIRQLEVALLPQVSNLLPRQDAQVRIASATQPG
jgi:CheY-like chemotaxis protein